MNFSKYFAIFTIFAVTLLESIRANGSAGVFESIDKELTKHFSKHYPYIFGSVMVVGGSAALYYYNSPSSAAPGLPGPHPQPLSNPAPSVQHPALPAPHAAAKPPATSGSWWPF
jgi:hypothetical protein